MKALPIYMFMKNFSVLCAPITKQAHTPDAESLSSTTIMILMRNIPFQSRLFSAAEGKLAFHSLHSSSGNISIAALVLLAAVDMQVSVVWSAASQQLCYCD